jgi:hypothetical protein
VFVVRLRPCATLALLLIVAAPAFGSHGIGTDLTSLNLCLYGDCEARGSYAADPYGLYNPAILTVGSLEHLPRGLVVSGSYFDLGIGAVDSDIGSGVLTFAHAPVAFQIAVGYAEAHGGVRPLPGVDMSFRTRAVRLAAGIDAERLFGLRGLSLGLAGVVPGTHSDLRLKMAGSTFVTSHETREVEIIPGVHWRGGDRYWFMAGAFLDALSNGVKAEGLDPESGNPLRRSGTTNAWFARAGTSILPFVPLGLADGPSPRAQWLRWLRLGIDVEYRNISVPDEDGRSLAIAYFGADNLLLPDAFNPLAGWVRPWLLGGVDTQGGWGAGLGAYGRGPLRMVGCNAALSSRPIVQYLGHRVEALAFTCSVMIPL